MELANEINVFILSTSISILILVIIRLLANPTSINKSMRECESFEEIEKIKERILSFFYGIVALNMVTLAITIIYIQLSNQLNFIISEILPMYIISSIFFYLLILIFVTLIGELLLRIFNPILQT